jgi:hypothetical protein
MKLHLLNISGVLLLIGFMLSCAKETNDYYNYEPASSISQTPVKGFINLLDLDTEVITLNIKKDGGDDFSSLNIVASVSPHSSIVQVGTLSGTNGTFSISVTELLAKLNKNPGDVKVGETIRFYADINQNNNKVIRDKDVVTLPFSCPSNLVGVYTSLTTGSSTDGCCPNPEVDFPGEVTITKLSDGRYQLNDFSAGLYLKWYSIYGISSVNDSPGKILDVCSKITFYDTTEPFLTPVTGEGTVDNDTGIITYSWENGYGDKGTVVLTPK